MSPQQFVRNLVLVAACVLSLPAAAKAVPGVPLMRHYGADDTKSAPGYLGLATGTNGELFVGNSDGVLRYDGVEWTLTPLPGHSPARALATGADGLVYVGGYDTFGRLARSSAGGFVYEDLLAAAGLGESQRHIGILWEVLAGPGGVWFHAEHSLHYLPHDGSKPRSWPLPDTVRSFYVVGDDLLVRVDGTGLCRFVDGRFELVPDGALFADIPLPGIVDTGEGQLLVSRDGLYRRTGDGIVPVPGKASDVLSRIRTYVASRLGDGSIMVGGLNGELVRLGPDLALREQIDLGGFGVNALGLDFEGGVWVATEDDLVRLSLPSPWSFLGESQGLVGTPQDFEWYDGALWVASSRGMLRLQPAEDGQMQAEPLPWTDFEAQALHAGKAGLLVGLREGLSVLDPGAKAPRRLYENALEGVFALLASDYDPGLVYALASNEIVIARERDGRWQLDHVLPLEGISISGLEETGPGELWMGDTRGPVQRWRLDPATGEVKEKTRFGDSQGLAVDAQAGTSVYQLDGRVHAVSGHAGFRFDGERFVPDLAPPFTLVERPDELVVEQTPMGDFAYTTRQLWMREPNQAEWQPLYPASQRAAGYSNLHVGSDGVLRISTWNGLLQYDPGEAATRPRPLQLGMESVQARNSDGEALQLPTRTETEPAQVPPGHSLNLRFEMVSMESGAEFRYLLHGVMPEWSDWTDRDLFIRALSAGDYALEVQARTRNGRQAPTMNYRFQVQPHWYERWWVLALGLAALAGLAVAVTLWAVRQRTERYLEANRRLEARIGERTRELEALNRKLAELVTEDALTGIANRRALENGLRREWFRCLDQQRALSVLMIDVDHFKAYNDAHGHLEGDTQLKGVAQRLSQQHDPKRELLARYGGEEFALLLPGVNKEDAARRADQIRAAIAASDAGMTVSIGVAGFVPDLQGEPDNLLRRADAALYAAKRGGRNRVEADPG